MVGLDCRVHIVGLKVRVSQTELSKWGRWSSWILIEHSFIQCNSLFEVNSCFLGVIGRPRNQTTPLVMSIYQNAFRYQNMGWAAAISLVLFAIILVVTVAQFKLLRTNWEY